ncbi:hypothetical protein PF008_g23581 [Phytophthora fragariae]|uniref:Uncharacterized protein n=1 Tax=Phytophthora fragariae TaxID=53985 RepID=A0A6A3EJ54_9STRA|nr:hypothetical protein PF009_g17450 [Phytophthora fragariae]KAE9298092.1 hypothetical protein PF008_g23581 [Phytophthora fragariae]
MQYDTIKVSTFAVETFLVTRALLPNLRLAAKSHGIATVAQVSSFLDSLGCNTSETEQFFGHAYAYATSKATLNVVTRLLSVGLRDSNIVFVTLNPGYVDTDMNDHKGTSSPPESAESIVNIVTNLSMKDTGSSITPASSSETSSCRA